MKTHTAKEHQKGCEMAALICIPIVLALIFFSTRSEGAESDFSATAPECENCFTYFEPQPRVWESNIEIVLNPDMVVNLDLAIIDMVEPMPSPPNISPPRS